MQSEKTDERKRMAAKKSIEVVAAVIYWEDKILCMQRGQNQRAYISEKWEFPGGKIEDYESQETALKREILEELHLAIEIKSPILTVHHEYPDFNLIMHAFECHTNEDSEPIITRTEHLDHLWLNPCEPSFRSLDWAGADIPIVAVLAEST